MKLENCQVLIDKYIKLTNLLYGDILFDEWVVITFRDGKGKILSYWGTRKISFQENFTADISALSSAIKSGSYGVGDFEFDRHAVGTKVDAFIVIGANTFLLCNNLSKSMAEIVNDSKWLAAQSAFAELCDHFRNDPLQPIINSASCVE